MYLDSSHVSWLVKVDPITTSTGSTIDIYEFRHTNDEKILSKWAKHFRNHYCLDEQIDILRSGTKKSRADYLKDMKFPSNDGFGPGTKSGDFTEILIADYLEFILSYSLLGIIFNGFCFINLIPHFFDYLMCPYYPALYDGLLSNCYRW